MNSLKFSPTLLAITLCASFLGSERASASLIVDIGNADPSLRLPNDNPSDNDAFFAWRDSGLTLNNTQLTTTSSSLSVPAAGGVEAFTFIFTVTSTSAEFLSDSGGRLASGGGLFNEMGEGFQMEIIEVSNSNVQFDGFSAAEIGGNGGADVTRFTSGENTFTSNSNSRIPINPLLFGSGTEFTLDGLGGGTRINFVSLQFSAVPEVSSFAILGLGLTGLAFLRWRPRLAA